MMIDEILRSRTGKGYEKHMNWALRRKDTSK